MAKEIVSRMSTLEEVAIQAPIKESLKEVTTAERILARSKSHIPKAPVESPLFRKDDDALDRLQSKIPYPPSSARLLSVLDAFRSRRSQSLEHRRGPNRKLTSQNTSISEGDRTATYVRRDQDLEKRPKLGLEPHTDTTDYVLGQWTELETSKSWTENESRTDNPEPIRIQNDSPHCWTTQKKKKEYESIEKCEKWEIESFVSEASSAESLLSYNSLDVFATEDFMNDKSKKGPILEPIAPTFLHDCMKSLNSVDTAWYSFTPLQEEEQKKQNTMTSETSGFCQRAVSYLAQQSNDLNCCEYETDKFDECSQYKNELLPQVASAINNFGKPWKQSKIGYELYHCQDDSIPISRDDADSLTAATASLKASSSLISSQEINRRKLESRQRGSGHWFLSALGISLKLLAIVSGIALVINDVKKSGGGDQHKIPSPYQVNDPSMTFQPIFMAPENFPNNGAFPASLLDLSSPLFQPE